MVFGPLKIQKIIFPRSFYSKILIFEFKNCEKLVDGIGLDKLFFAFVILPS